MATKGLQAAREQSRARILAGQVDRQAAARYRELAASGNWPGMAEEFKARAAECERIAGQKLRAKV